MFKKRPEFRNNLTRQIEEGIEVEDLLKSVELSDTVRNEAPALMKYIFPPEEMEKENPNLPKLDELIKLSLFPDENPDNEFKLYQLNRNASNIFSSASNKIQDNLQKDKTKRYFRALRSFIFGPNNREVMFTGHFQRMFETSLRLSGDVLIDPDNKFNYNDKFNENSFLTFIITNSDLLSYRELISDIISEFTSFFPNIIDETLRYAAIATLHIDESTEYKQKALLDDHDDDNDVKKISPPDNDAKKISPPDNDAKEISPPDNDAKKISPRDNYVKIILPPDNCQGNPIPCRCDLYYQNPPNIYDFTEEAEFIKKIKKDISFEDLRESDIYPSLKKKVEERDARSENTRWSNFALNLIYGVKNGYEMDLNDDLQKKVKKDIKENKESNVIRCLLICGMFADSLSSLSYTSFNLLFNLLNKKHVNSEGFPDDKYILNLNPPKIIDEYAEHFKFDPFNVSENMISALLVFWNHRYKNIPHNQKSNESKEVLKDLYKTKVGVTPLEYLLPTILTEPLCSSKLGNIFSRILKSLKQEIADIINKEKNSEKSKLFPQSDNSIDNENDDDEDKQIESPEYREKRCFEIDSIWYELLSYEFKYNPNDSKYITLPHALEFLLPLPTTELKQTEGEKKPPLKRAPTNPLFFQLSHTICHGPFFAFKNGKEFRRLFSDDKFDIVWAIHTFVYHDTMEKIKNQQVELPYPDMKKKNKKPKKALHKKILMNDQI